jgi:hypothetical protein
VDTDEKSNVCSNFSRDSQSREEVKAGQEIEITNEIIESGIEVCIWEQGCRIINTSQIWSLWEMYQFYAHYFYELAKYFSVSEIALSKEDIPHIRNMLENVKTVTNQIGLCQSFKKADELHDLFGEDWVTIDSCANSLRGLNWLIKSELEESYFLHLTRSEADLYTHETPIFGKDFQSNFSGALYDLDEAVKCIALKRSTASVFHLMRIMETGIQAVSRCLGIPDPTKLAGKNWGAILIKIKNDGIDIKTNWNRDDKELFNEIYICLDSVRIAWRNSTMHIVKTYTPDEAEHILLVVKGFMKQVAARMDEKGQPLA